jgi:hypothetical protein
VSKWPQPKHHKRKCVNEYLRKPFYRIGHSTQPVVERLRKEYQQHEPFGFAWSLEDQWQRMEQSRQSGQEPA